MMAKIELEGMLDGIEADNGDGGAGWTYLVLDGYDLDSQIIRGLDAATHRGWGRCRITIEQLPDKSPEAVAKRVVERHRETLDILKEADAEAWTPPEALVVRGDCLESARAILRAEFEAHGRAWDDSMYSTVTEIG